MCLFFGAQYLEKLRMLGKHIKHLPLTFHGHIQGQINECACICISIITELVHVKLILNLNRQEVVPNDGLKTQEVDISMPGIPPLCSLRREKSDYLIPQ